MHKEDTGLRPETIEHVVKLYNRVVSDLILSGYSVNTGLYHAVAQLRGVIDGGKWNPEKNSVYVSFTQDKELREAIAQTSISILGERQSVMYVAGFSPATVTTQYAGSTLLKTPRTAIATFYVGTKPDAGGGSGSGGSEGGGGEAPDPAA